MFCFVTFGYLKFYCPKSKNNDCSVKGGSCENPLTLNVADFERPCVNLAFATDSGVNPSCATPENAAIKDYWFIIQTDDIGSLKLEIGDQSHNTLNIGYALYEGCQNSQAVLCSPSPISNNNHLSWTLPAEFRIPNKIWYLQVWAYADNEQTVCINALPECGITNTTIGTATCIDETTFNQDIEIEFFNIPGKDLIVYDPLDNYKQILSTPFTSSPQTITITGLDATATEIDFDLSISGAHGCTTKFLDNIPIPDCNNGNDCSDTPLVISNTLSTDATFKSKISITSTATILSNTNINFQAGQSITLAAGFHAQAGSNFLAQIADCQIQTIQESTDITPVNNKSATEANVDLLAKEVAPEVADLKIAPNPFNQQTQIDYYLPKGGFTHLSIRDITGQIVAPMVAEDKGKGWHQIQFNNTNLLSGIYYLSMYTENNIISKKIVILNN